MSLTSLEEKAVRFQRMAAVDAESARKQRDLGYFETARALQDRAERAYRSAREVLLYILTPAEYAVFESNLGQPSLRRVFDFGMFRSTSDAVQMLDKLGTGIQFLEVDEESPDGAVDVVMHSGRIFAIQKPQRKEGS